MRRGSLIAAAVAGALLVAGSIVPVAGAGGPLTLKRTYVVKGKAKVQGGHFKYRTVLRSPGKGIVGTARVRCSRNNRCSVRSKFSEGRINVRGVVDSGNLRDTLPIVSGTKTFRRATGKFVARPARSSQKILWIYKLESFG